MGVARALVVVGVLFGVVALHALAPANDTPMLTAAMRPAVSPARHAPGETTTAGIAASASSPKAADHGEGLCLAVLGSLALAAFAIAAARVRMLLGISPPVTVGTPSGTNDPHPRLSRLCVLRC